MRRARSAASGTVSSCRDPAACRSRLLCSRSPHSLGYFDDARQLCPLLVFRKRVTFFGAGEPTLRTETELIEIHEFGRLLDSPLQVVDRLQCAVFEVTTPRTTLFPLGTNRKGSKPPARSESNSMKY